MKIDPIFRPLTSKCDHDLGAMDLRVTHGVIMINISTR